MNARLDPSLIDAMTAAYSASAATWATGPARIYGALADALVDHAARAGASFAGVAVLDLGAGTGVLSEAARRRDAHVIAADLAWGMLDHHAASRPPAAVGDARCLPFRRDAFDAIGAAFSLTHVPEPLDALTEISRTLRAGGWVFFSSYHHTNDHPAKAATDQAAAEHGFVAPDWHGTLKAATEPAFATATSVEDLLRTAAFEQIDVRHVQLDIGIDDSRTMVEWRLGMASLSPFVADLDDDRRERLIARALELVGPEPIPYRPQVILAAARTSLR